MYTQRGTSAGTAWLESYEIRLNPVLLLENIDTFIAEVVPHELAHLLVWKPLRTQGSAWQGMEVG
ncbi:Protein sprT [Salmonella enterica subsp. enterica]|nr:Protein sprT [Salmonella enterica subsp. enterica] [Salmonella enterica subsp. enterica serovar Menston]